MSKNDFITNSERPAYPVADLPENYQGLTKREMFAMAAMQGLISQASSSIESSDKYTCNGGWVNPETIALNAVKMANELLKQLEK